jgi:hypothetical protein
MSVQENEALARRMFDEVWSQGKLELADDFLSRTNAGTRLGVGESRSRRRDEKHGSSL